MKDMMKDMLEERKKKALAVTILIPMNKGEEKNDKEEEKDEKEMDLAPKLKEDKEVKDAFMGGAEDELRRKKKSGMKPRNFEERASMEMLED